MAGITPLALTLGSASSIAAFSNDRYCRPVVPGTGTGAAYLPWSCLLLILLDNTFPCLSGLDQAGQTALSSLEWPICEQLRNTVCSRSDSPPLP